MIRFWALIATLFVCAGSMLCPVRSPALATPCLGFGIDRECSFEPADEQRETGESTMPVDLDDDRDDDGNETVATHGRAMVPGCSVVRHLLSKTVYARPRRGHPPGVEEPPRG